MISFWVDGVPAPQGSKRPVRAGGKTTGRVVLVESSKKVGPWRDAVKAAAMLARNGSGPITGPVRLVVDFRLTRPASHFRRGANGHLLRPDAPAWPIGYPDLDKLLRSTCDALVQAGLLADDAQVVEILSSKLYTGLPGAVIRVGEL
jgi:Holliday junction resolvase RusA-like endonuclease